MLNIDSSGVLLLALDNVSAQLWAMVEGPLDLLPYSGCMLEQSRRTLLWSIRPPKRVPIIPNRQLALFLATVMVVGLLAHLWLAALTRAKRPRHGTAKMTCRLLPRRTRVRLFLHSPGMTRRSFRTKWTLHGDLTPRLL